MSQIIEVEIGGDVVGLDIDLESLTMREAVRLEEALGPETFDRLMEGDLKISARPTVIRAVIWAKLLTVRPDIPLDGFDLDLGALAESVQLESGGDPPKLQGVG